MLSNELREKLIDFAEDSISVQEIEEWLVPRLPDFLHSPIGADADLIAVLELALAELSAGIKTEDDVREMMHKALQAHPSSWMFYSPISNQRTISGSSGTTSVFGHSTTNLELNYETG